MNYVYLGVSFNENFQQDFIYISHIGSKLKLKQLYVKLTDKELKEACEERLYASVRFIYDKGSSQPSSVILIKDGEELSENEHEYCLDDLIASYFEDSSDESSSPDNTEYI